MAQFGNGAHTIIGVGGATNLSLTAGTTNATFNIIGALGTFNIASRPGAVLSVNNLVNVANRLNLDTNGGNITLASTAGVLGATTVAVDNGGSFTVAATLLSANVLSAASLSFVAGGGTATIGSSSLITVNLLSAFAPIIGYTSTADVIDDRALSFANVTGYTITGSPTNQTIIITASNGTSFSFATNGSGFVDGSYTIASGPLHLVADSTGGTEIAACFLEGTLISTPRGEVPVQSLTIGDVVLTADGAQVPVRWVGRNTVIAHSADPLRTLPVRVREGALGDNVPRQDLLLSPEHALLIDGLLIQAGALVNGMSIVREYAMPTTFIYYHVEVEHHAVILANGTPAETFVDHISRMVFDNWAEHRELYGDEDCIPEMEYPRVLSARQIPDRIERDLLERANAMGVGDDAAANFDAEARTSSAYRHTLLQKYA